MAVASWSNSITQSLTESVRYQQERSAPSDRCVLLEGRFCVCTADGATAPCKQSPLVPPCWVHTERLAWMCSKSLANRTAAAKGVSIARYSRSNPDEERECLHTYPCSYSFLTLCHGFVTHTRVRAHTELCNGCLSL